MAAHLGSGNRHRSGVERFVSDFDRRKWNRRYREESRNRGDPSDLLQRWLPRLPRGRALDIACGAGRNAILLAQSGYQVDAIDISSAGLRRAREQAAQRGITVNWIEHDLDLDFDFARDYALIVVLWYVNLPLIARLAGCLSPGGCLLCEEHLQTDESVSWNHVDLHLAMDFIDTILNGLTHATLLSIGTLIRFDQGICKDIEGHNVLTTTI